MPHCYQSKIINAPIEKVWDTIKCFHTLEWAPNVVTSTEKVGTFKGNEVGAKRILNEVFHETLVDICDIGHTFSYSIDEGVSPVSSLFETLKNAPNILPFGCPLNKMSQEMVYIDDDFKKVLVEVYNTFENLITQILEKEKLSNASSQAKRIIATYEGALMIYHLNQNKGEFSKVLTDFSLSLNQQ